MAKETPDRSDLELANRSVAFLLLLIFAVLLSLAALLRQRLALRAALAGRETRRCPDPYPLQRASGAISVGALGYFLTVAIQGWAAARQEGRPQELCLAQANLWAALFVLAAAVLRLLVLDASHGKALPAQEADLPA